MAIYNGRELEVNNNFSDEYIVDNGKIFLYGLYSNIQHISSKVKKFKRYHDIRSGDSWYVGRDRWDGIIFQPSKTIRVYGIGIYE